MRGRLHHTVYPARGRVHFALGVYPQIGKHKVYQGMVQVFRVLMKNGVRYALKHAVDQFDHFRQVVGVKRPVQLHHSRCRSVYFCVPKCSEKVLQHAVAHFLVISL